jgi:hypothetical protein
MNKVPISVTLDTDNLLWLKARTQASGSRSVSAVLDELITKARRSKGPATSVVGLVSFPEGVEGLERGTQEVRQLFERSLSSGREKRRRRG